MERPDSGHSQHQRYSGLGPAPFFEETQWMACSITQIVIGALCVIFNSVELACARSFYPPSIEFALAAPVETAGYWCGAFLVAAGGLGIATAKSKIRSPVIAFAIICIISILSFYTLYVGSIASAHIAHRGQVRITDAVGYYNDYSKTSSERQDNARLLGGVAAMEALLVICAIAGSTIDIWGILLASTVIIHITMYGPPVTKPKIQVRKEKTLTVAEERYMMTKGKEIADRRSAEHQEVQHTDKSAMA